MFYNIGKMQIYGISLRIGYITDCFGSYCGGNLCSLGRIDFLDIFIIMLVYFLIIFNMSMYV
jgi:hypothetical protein